MENMDNHGRSTRATRMAQAMDMDMGMGMGDGIIMMGMPSTTDLVPFSFPRTCPHPHDLPTF